MVPLLREFIRVSTAYVLLTLFVVPLNVKAQTHVVSPADLQKQVLAASAAREHNLASVRRFLSSEKAEHAIRSARMNPTQVKAAVATLSDEELAQLASRADKAQADFAAGNLSDRDLLLIIVAVAALILIIVAVR